MSFLIGRGFAEIKILKKTKLVLTLEPFEFIPYSYIYGFWVGV